MLCSTSLPEGVSFLRVETWVAAGDDDLMLRLARSVRELAWALLCLGEEAASCSKGLTYVNIPPLFCAPCAPGELFGSKGSKGVGVFSLLPNSRIGDWVRPAELLLPSATDGC